MKGSSMISVENDTMVIIRTSYCKAFGSPCAAALVNFYSFWHDINLAKFEQQKEFNKTARVQGQPINRGYGLLQGHKQAQLVEAMQGLFTKHEIVNANKSLIEMGVITIHRNPLKGYNFDRTNYFLFHPKKANSILSISHSRTLHCPHTDNGETTGGQWSDRTRTSNSIDYTLEDNNKEENTPAPEKTETPQNKKTKEPKTPAPLSLKNKLTIIEDEDEAAEAIKELLEKDKGYFTEKYSVYGFNPEYTQYYADLIAGQHFKNAKILAADEKNMKSIIKTWSTFIFRKVNEGITPNSTLSNGFAQKNAPIEQYSEAYLLKILTDTDKHWVKDLKEASPQELAAKLQTWKERKVNDETMIGAFPQFAEKRIKAAYASNLAK